MSRGGLLVNWPMKKKRGFIRLVNVNRVQWRKKVQVVVVVALMAWWEGKGEVKSLVKVKGREGRIVERRRKRRSRRMEKVDRRRG